MDIGAELVRLASEGLSVIEVLSTWLPKGCELSYVSNALKTVLETPVYYHYDPQGDALERNVAAALRQVDELLRREVALKQRWNPRAQAPAPLPPVAVEELKLLQHCVQDAVVMA